MSLRLQQKGQENITKLFNITKKDLEFIGRIFELERDIKVSKVELISNNLTCSKVYLNKNVSREKIVELLTSVGLEYPEYEKKTHYGYYFNVGGRVVRIYC